jgi:uncharacterized protein (TIGR00369 family)
MSDSSPLPGPYNGFSFEIPFVLDLGFELHAFADGVARLLFKPRAEHLNSFEVVHGGALMTLLDVAMANAARSVDPDFGVVTIEMKTTFLHPAQGVLTCTGELMHRTRQLAFTEARVRDEQGRVCAHATGTFRYVPRPDHGAAGQPRRPATD